MRNQKRSASGSGEREPFQDLTNTPIRETADHAAKKETTDNRATSVITINNDDLSQTRASSSPHVPRTPLGNITNSNVNHGKNWYARMSDEKRAEYNQRRRMARADKKAASLIANSHDEVSETHASSSMNVPQTPVSNLTAATLADAEHRSEDASRVRSKRISQVWYARLSDKEKAEHCKMLRIACQEKRSATADVQVSPAQSGFSHMLNSPCSGSSMHTDGRTEWLHTNPTYKRQTMDVHAVFDMSETKWTHGQESFLPGSNPLHSFQMKEASSHKKRRRMREQYDGMTPEEKEVVLQRNRGVQPDCHTNGEESDDAGILEPTEPPNELNECLHDAQYGSSLYDDDDDDDECRIFTGKGDEFESYRVTPNGSHAYESDDPYNYVYKNLPTKHHVLKPVKDCVHCGAMRFQYEGPAFCCRKGKVKVCTPDVPQELQRLFSSLVDKDAKYFRQHIRYFNSHFAFTSLGVSLDQRVNTAARSGVYTFCAHGQLYHRLDHLVPADHGPRHLQLYIYDTDEALEHRVKRSPDLDINLIRKILGILENNPYVQTFKSLGTVPDLAEYKITLNTNIKLDQRRYNAPTASQVAAMWVEGSDLQHTFDRSVIVHAKGDRPLYVRAYYGCYDPFAYPLFYPGGET